MNDLASSAFPLPLVDSDLGSIAKLPTRRLQTPEPEGIKRRKYRAIWISDVHLGTKGCNAELLIDFLDHTDSETMYEFDPDDPKSIRLKKKFADKVDTSLPINTDINMLKFRKCFES